MAPRSSTCWSKTAGACGTGNMRRGIGSGTKRDRARTRWSIISVIPCCHAWMRLTGSFLIGRRSHVAHPSDNQSSSYRRSRCSANSAHAQPCRSSYPATVPRRHGLSRRSSKPSVSVSSRAPSSDSLVESHLLHLGLCLIIGSCFEISAHERCYHGSLQSHGCKFYPTGWSCAIDQGLILLSWFVRREEEETGGGADRRETSPGQMA